MPCSLAYRFHVGQVAQPSQLLLVPNQVFGREDMRRYALKWHLDSVPPCLVELNRVNGLQDVDPRRRLANLNDGRGVVAEIGRRQPRNRRTKRRECPIYGLAISNGGPDKQIEILRGSRLGVNTHRIPADHQILNPVCVERE